MRWNRLGVSVAALLAMTAAHAERDFSGQTPSGAYYRIAVPDSWKPGQVLVMYQHGLTFEDPGPNPDLGPLKDLQLSEGYAIAASSYRQRSWALFTAPDDNAELLTVFKQTVGAPGAIIPFGASLGGLVSLKLAEDGRFAPVPGVYSACPPAAGTRAWDEAIDLRLAYDVICKGAGDLPTGTQPTPWAYNLGDIPNDLSDLEDKAQLLQTLLPLNQCTGINLPSEIRNGAMKRRLAQLMALGHITDEDFFVINMGYATYALSDLVRAPDKLNDLNPFSTIGVDYNDDTLNDDIARISPEPFGQLYFKWSSDFRGRVSPSTKVISIQTSEDQLVIPANQDVLRNALPSSQLTSALVNESSPTHCGFTLAEGVAGWEALRAWVAGAPQPQVSDLQTTCNAAVAQGAAGPCRYDASITVPSFDSQVRPRQASTAAPVDAHYTGQWYDSTRGGEGISLEILPNDKALVYFFTYPPDGTAGKETWLTGVGDVVNNGIEFADVQLPALDANGNLASTHWGRIGLVFDDCNSGSMRWDGPPGWGSMEVPLIRLTSPQGLGCGVQGGMPPSANAATGAWFDPTFNGRGFIFDQLDSQRIATIWFGFDNSGVPVWLTGILGQDGNGNFDGSMVQSFGTHFGADFDSTSIQTSINGTLVAAPFACSSGSIQFQTAAGQLGLIPASLSLQRLTAPVGLPSCAP
ncbi:MAG TPA: hypothetical protein VH082_00620 [Rudaea sp.]|jgi:hypothetical protein|nr:hypothetical protein [Rudaea sp.]